MAATEDSLAGLVALLCEQQLFLPLLQSFELFTPSSSVIPFIRFLQVRIFEIPRVKVCRLCEIVFCISLIPSFCLLLNALSKRLLSFLSLVCRFEVYL